MFLFDSEDSGECFSVKVDLFFVGFFVFWGGVGFEVYDPGAGFLLLPALWEVDSVEYSGEPGVVDCGFEGFFPPDLGWGGLGA